VIFANPALNLKFFRRRKRARLKKWIQTSLVSSHVNEIEASRVNWPFESLLLRVNEAKDRRERQTRRNELRLEFSSSSELVHPRWLVRTHRFIPARVGNVSLIRSFMRAGCDANLIRDETRHWYFLFDYKYPTSSAHRAL